MEWFDSSGSDSWTSNYNSDNVWGDSNDSWTSNYNSSNTFGDQFYVSDDSWSPDWNSTFNFVTDAGKGLWNAATSQAGIGAIATGVGGYLKDQRDKDNYSDQLAFLREKLAMDQEMAMAGMASAEGIARMRIEAEERRRKEHNDSFAKPFTGAKKVTITKKPGLLG